MKSKSGDRAPVIRSGDVQILSYEASPGSRERAREEVAKER